MNFTPFRVIFFLSYFVVSDYYSTILEHTTVCTTYKSTLLPDIFDVKNFQTVERNTKKSIE